MTLGEKIRKYRVLHNKTQKQLGEEIGFKKNTADVRINQYEKNIMAPKADIRTAIAKALDVDMAALSDINISSVEDIMYILFELEEDLGMQIEKHDGKTSLVFDDNNSNIRMLITYLNLWKNQKDATVPDYENMTDEQYTAYNIWKSKFATNIHSYFDQKLEEIEKYYSKHLAELEKKGEYAKKSSEISVLFRGMIEGGFTISTDYRDLIPVGSPRRVAGPVFTFNVNELLAPPSKNAELIFAKYLFEIKHLEKLGVKIVYEILMLDKTLTISYGIPIPSFSLIKSHADMVLDHKNKNNDNDYYMLSFETCFSDCLKSEFVDIEEEAAMYGHLSYPD